MARLDLSKVNASNFLPEGESVCKIVKIESKLSKEAKTPMEEFTFRDRLGREERQHFVFTEKALFRIKGLAIAAGFDLEKTNWADFETRNLMGKSVLVVKVKKGMRTVATDTGPKEFPDYDVNFGPAGAAPAGGPPPAVDPMGELPDVGF